MNITGRCVYVIWGNSDLTEGRGFSFSIGVADYKSTADRFAKGKYVMGSDAPVDKVELVQFEGIWYLPINNVPMIKAEKGDKERDEKALSREQAIVRAKAIGLTEEEIKLIQSK